MGERQGLLSGGWHRVARNKRYIIWFYVLNVVLACLGAASFSNQAHDYLDHSLLSERLVHGFDVGVLIEMFAQPEFGPTHASRVAGLHFALLFSSRLRSSCLECCRATPRPTACRGKIFSALADETCGGLFV